MEQEVRLPELGENIDEVEVLQVLVKPGDKVKADQPVLEIETDKATVEVPVTVSGEVKSVKVQVGAKTRVGDLLMIVETNGAAAPDTASAAPPREKPSEKPKIVEEKVPPPPKVEAQSEPEPPPERPPERREPPPPAPFPSRSPVPAAPSVRRLARQLGVELTGLSGSGPGGRISEDDVKDQAHTIVSNANESAPLPDFAKWGLVRREPLRGVRRKTAEHLSVAWHNVVHVTQHDLADITEIEKLRRQYSSRAEAAGGKLTVTAILLKAVAGALKKFPQFATSLDMAREEVVFKEYIHIGVAVDTDRGLLVPVLHDVDRKSVIQLSVELSQLAEKARSEKLGLDEMQGGCFTITNLGGIGGTSFTPIVNWPEVAILGVSRARHEPVFRDDRFEPKLMLPLSLSYDHRVVDGAMAARFLRWVAETLEDPFVLFLES